MSPLRLLRSTCAAAAIGCLAVAAGAPAGPPGMWFWGTGSDVSTSAIKSFTSGLGARAPQIHYSIGGCSMTATSMECTKLNLTMVTSWPCFVFFVFLRLGTSLIRVKIISTNAQLNVLLAVACINRSRSLAITGETPGRRYLNATLAAR